MLRSFSKYTGDQVFQALKGWLKQILFIHFLITLLLAVMQVHPMEGRFESYRPSLTLVRKHQSNPLVFVSRFW